MLINMHGLNVCWMKFQISTCITLSYKCNLWILCKQNMWNHSSIHKWQWYGTQDLKSYKSIEILTSLEMAILILVVRFLFKKSCLESHPAAKEGSQTKHWISSVLYYCCVTANTNKKDISCFRGVRYLEWQ